MKLLLFFKRNLLFIAILFIGLLTLFYSYFVVKKGVISGDGIGYYSYVYDLFKAGDLSFKNTDLPNFGVIEQDNLPNNLNKYPVGTSIFLIPPYFTAEITAQIFFKEQTMITQVYPPVYQITVGIFAVIYLVIALKILEKILLKFFDRTTRNITLISIALGTNLLIYTSVEAAFSHVYSFLALNLFIFLLIRWFDSQSKKNSILLGLSIGLVLLLRQSNITILAIFMLYGINIKSLKRSIQSQYTFYKKNFKKLVLIGLTAVAAFIPQMIYWLFSTGNPLIYSYQNETFDFLKPQIFGVLFGIEQGLFLWSPILIIAICGFWFSKKYFKNLSLALLIFMILNTYIIASWWMWDYGIGFGHRAFTDFLGIFTLWLAALISEARQSRIQGKILFIALPIIIFLNMALGINYIKQRIYYNHITFSNIIESLQKFRLK